MAVVEPTACRGSSPIAGLALPHGADAPATSSAREPLEVNLDTVIPTHLNRFRDIQRTRRNRVSQRLEHLDSVTSTPSYFNQFAAARPVTE